MITILPPGAPPRPGAPQPSTAGGAPGIPDFASLLDAARDEAGGLSPAPAEEPGALPLRDRIAAVFNQFGFFQANPGEGEEMPPANPAEQGEAPVPADPDRPVSPLPQEASEVRNDGPREAAVETARPAPTIPASANVIAGAAAVRARMAEHPVAAAAGAFPASAAPVPMHIIAEAPGPRGGIGETPPWLASRMPILRAAPLRVQPLGLPNEPPAANGPGALADGEGERGPGRPLHERPVEPGDRLAFRIGEELVELVGRMENLSEDEEKKLADALSALLESHGLALGSATINGRPFTSAFPGGQG